MTPWAARDLWNRLADAGLALGDAPEAEAVHVPWTVRLMLGVAGCIAALFLLGFIGAAFAWVLNSKTAAFAVGLLLVAGAYAVFRIAPRGDFVATFALSLSFAGQMLAGYGIFGMADRAFSAPPWLALALLEVLLALVLPNFLHRVVATYAAGVAFAAGLAYTDARFLAAGLLGAGVAFVWLNEGRLGKWHEAATPIGYGLTLALIQLECGTFLGRTVGGVLASSLGASGSGGMGETLIVAALLVTVWALLERAGWYLSERRSLLALGAAAAVGLASYKAPGIAAGLMIVLLGFANGNRVLLGLGVAALLFYVSSYYYLLEVSLLAKAGVLAATGAVLLAARWLALHVLLREEPADA